MEGVLWKWTNYWSGWQPRWFVLDNGVLAYYKSQEEVNQGCKGSIKMSVCEIIVNPADNTRLDLVIPSEQHFYLKAATPQERQQWLVALGTAKASRSARQKKDSTSANPDMLKTKKSELRLYCDLLMQQVHTVKSAAMEKSPPDPETLTEATSLLGATCDTFIKTLEECMKLANANFPYELPHQLITDSALPPSLGSSNALKKTTKSQVNRSTSVDSSL